MMMIRPIPGTKCRRVDGIPSKEEWPQLEGEAYRQACAKIVEWAAQLIFAANYPKRMTDNEDEFEALMDDIRSHCADGFISLMEKPAKTRNAALGRVIEAAEKSWNSAFRLGCRRRGGKKMCSLDDVEDSEVSATNYGRIPPVLNNLTDYQFAAFQCTANSIGLNREKNYYEITGRLDCREQFEEAKKILKGMKE